MPPPHVPSHIDDEPTFERALAAVVRTATENDVDVSGGWAVHTDDGSPDWDVVITWVEPNAE
ncbi:MAG: hypothetical protein ABEJ76_08200 [Halanaeroarchaeum sp.]